MTTATSTAASIEHPSERMKRDLTTRVEGALWAYDPIRQSRSRIAVTESEPGRVALSGVVPSQSIRLVAQRIAQGVRGVTNVDNELVSDTEIESDVSLAIASDADVDPAIDHLRVSSYLGLVYLDGRASAEDLEAAAAAVDRAGAIAGDVRGVSGVINRLVATEADADVAPDEADEDDDSGPSPEEEAKAERLSVWRERAGQEDA